MTQPRDATLQSYLVVGLAALGVALVLALSGCAAPRVVLVRSAETLGTGSVLPCCGAVLTVPHVAPGSDVRVVTRWSRVPARVVRREPHWILIRPERDLRPGDSGSPVYVTGGWDDGHPRPEWLVGAVEARR